MQIKALTYLLTYLLTLMTLLDTARVVCNISLFNAAAAVADFPTAVLRLPQEVSESHAVTVTTATYGAAFISVSKS